MAGSANTDAANQDAAMRRIAIVLTSLPASVAAKLMGTINQDSKQILRRTMATLTDVDPLERHRALQAFKVSVQQPSQRTPGDRFSEDTFTSHAGAGEFRPSDSAEVVKDLVNGRPVDPASPLAFLSDVEDDDLVELLAGEHAQAVALVLASITASQSARILPRLETSLRSSALSRLGRLTDIPETAASEVAQHFKKQLGLRSSTSTRSTNAGSGKRALDAILAAMPKTATPDVPTSNSAGDEAARDSASRVERPSISYDPSVRPSVDEFYRQRDVSLADSPSTPRTAAPTTDAVVRANAALANPESTTKSTSTSSFQFESTDAIHKHLILIKTKDLCRALGLVETRDAMLALCGLPNAKSESVLAMLPRDQSKFVRAQMNSLQSLNLREIDRAKERVAIASMAGKPSPQSSDVTAAA